MHTPRSSDTPNALYRYGTENIHFYLCVRESCYFVCIKSYRGLALVQFIYVYMCMVQLYICVVSRFNSPLLLFYERDSHV